MAELSQAAKEYNPSAFRSNELERSRDVGQLDFNPNLHVGMPAPDFTVTDLDGKSTGLSDYLGKKHVVFEFGCITAPVFINDIVTLNHLHARYRDEDIQFLIVYAREAHPGENYPAHTAFEQKLAHARDLQRLENVQFPVVVDSLEGEAHRRYGLRPSPVYVINKDGLIVYKASWLNPDELDLALGQLVRAGHWQAGGRRPLRQVYSELWTSLWINRSVHERVFDRAGKGAREDVARAFGYDPVTGQSAKRRG